MLLRDLGEGGLIDRIRERFADPAVTIGIGDDAAVAEFPAGHALVFCSDLLSENTHFIRDLHPPDAIGYKAVAVNVSDIGAMGGVPMHFTVALAAPPGLEVSWLDGFYDGVSQACRDFDVSLVGGDTSTGEHLFVDVAMVGRVVSGQAVRRSGASPGDGIYVTGMLGGSARGLEALRTGQMEDNMVRRHLYPQPRHRVGLNVGPMAHAMIDVSDGLSTDLAHILTESKVSARIYRDRIPAAPGATPIQVLHGGEEYELIIVAPQAPDSIEGIPLHRIGEIIPSAIDHELYLIDGVLETVLQPQGWRHF